MALCTNSQYARYRRCNPSSVTRAIQRGTIRLTSEGKIDTGDADARWPLDCEPDLEAIVGHDERMSFDEATRRKVAAQALLAELELKTREGALLDAAAVVKAWVAHGANIKAKLRNLPPRLAAACVGKSLVEAEAEALREVDAILTEIADTPPDPS